MLNKERLIHYGVILLLFSVIIYFLSIGDERYIEKYNREIKQLQTQVDSLKNVNRKIYFEIDKLNLEVVSLDSTLNVKDLLIKKLKYKTNEETSAVDSFDNNKLNSFFTERYRYDSN